MEEIGNGDLLEMRSDDLTEKKRPVECVTDGELNEPVVKKARFGDGLLGNMKKVAEIVLVLAAMGKMRGGRCPTVAEKEMMVEAREKLVNVCQEFAPKDVFPRDVFGSVIEDLGLNKLREHRLGFRPPKMSIAEKLLLTKRKMEKSEEFAMHSTYPSQQPQTNSASAVENRGPSHAVRIFPSDKSSHAPNTSGGLQPALPSHSGHVSSAKSTSLPYQLPTSEVRPIVSSGLPSSQLGKDTPPPALPKVERPHFRLDGRSNGSTFTPQVQANSSGVHTTVKVPTWSVQPQSSPLTKNGLDNKVTAQALVKVDGGTDVSTLRIGSQPTTKPFITQTMPGNLSSIHQSFQGINVAPVPPVSNSHTEIGRIVQKLLQPQLPGQLSWTPPSRDYMNKALYCQVCKATINDVDSVLVCDACEKGFHLKCLQLSNQKVIPRSDWHCPKCLELSNGKPLPPKYGRVMRNVSTSKVSSNAVFVQPSSEKKVGNVDVKDSQLNTTVNGNFVLQSVPMGNHSQPTSDLKLTNAKEVQRVESLPNGGKTDVDSTVESNPDNLITTSDTASTSTVVSGEKLIAEIAVTDVRLFQDSTKSDTISKSGEDLQALSTSQNNGQIGRPDRDEFSIKNCLDNHSMVNEFKKSNDDEVLGYNSETEISQTKVISSQGNTVENSVAADHGRSSLENLCGVDWIGDTFQVVDNKVYYQACCVSGIVHKVHDHALIRNHKNKLIPSKLKAMWEDGETRSKWVAINLCYFPDDLPEFGRPCTSESCEVYESVHQTTVLASMIHGSCEVLPPSKFMEESKRRAHRGIPQDDRLRPLFLCKWFYDETKRLFRDVST